MQTLHHTPKCTKHSFYRNTGGKGTLRGGYQGCQEHETNDQRGEVTGHQRSSDIASVAVARQDAALQHCLFVAEHSARVVHGLQGADADHHLNVGPHCPPNDLDAEVGREVSGVSVLGYGAVGAVVGVGRVDWVVAVFVAAIQAVARETVYALAGVQVHDEQEPEMKQAC